MNQKKGLSPLAWIAIGCGGIILIGLVVVVAGGLFVAKKATEVAQEFQKNPAYSYAKLIAAANPDIEVVSSDDEKQTVSLKNKKTGEVATIDLEGLKEGRISWITSEGKVSIGADVGDIPEWVPVRPGSEAKLNFSASADGGVSGTVSFTSEDGVDDVLDWYRDQLEGQGYQVQTYNADLGDQGKTGTVSGVNEDAKHRVSISVSGKDGQTTGLINFSDIQP